MGAPLPSFPREVPEWQGDLEAGLWVVQPLS